MQFKRQQRKHPHANMIPLINVIFLLLIFFIVTGTYEKETIQEVAIPLAETGRDMVEQPLTLVVTDDGMVSINDIPIPPGKVYKELSSLLQEKHTKADNLVVMADAGLNARVLLDVIADAERAGVGEIALVTNKAKQ